MKKSLLLFLVISYNPLTAQDYNLFQSNSRYYFTNGATLHEQLFGFACDSAKLTGTDSVFYPYRTLGYSPSLGFCNIIPNFPQWPGEHIDQNAAGKYTLYTVMGDSLHIKPATPVNDTFLFYTYANNNKMLAICNNTLFQTFAGITDSVKVFYLQVVNPAGVAVTNNWNGRRIRISKNNGMVEFPNVRDFPIDTTMFVRAVGKRLKYSDIYTWQPGDVLHQRFTSNSTTPPWYVSSSTLYNITILTRNQVNADSVVFTMARKMHYTVNYPPTSTFSADTVSLSVGKLTGFIHTEMPDQTIDSVHTYSLYARTIDCGNLRMVDHVWNSISNQGGGCIHFESFEPYYRDSVYIENIAGHFIDEFPHFFNNYSYVGHYNLYSNVGGNICGTPSFVEIDEEITAENKFNVWPNPASNNINWSLEETRGTLKIYSVAGKQVAAVPIEQTNSLNISHLSAGCYTIVVETIHGFYTSKLMVVK